MKADSGKNPGVCVSLCMYRAGWYFFFSLFKKVFDLFGIYVKLKNFPLHPKSFGSFALHAAVAQG